MNIASAPTVLAAADLVSGSHSLYTIGVGVLVVLILLAEGAELTPVIPTAAAPR